MAPSTLTAAVMAKAQKNWPVRPTTKPVSAGATIPAKLPTKFCKPVHLPATRAPASVWVTAHRFEEQIPIDTQTRNSKAMAPRGSRITDTSTMEQEKSGPAPVNVLRTRVTEAPAAIQRSEAHPEIAADTAVPRKATPLTTDIVEIEKWRSCTR